MKKLLVILFFISLFLGIAFNVAANTINDTTPPVADPNGPYTVVYGNDWILDGTGSWDSQSAIDYFWDVDNDGIFNDFFGDTPTVGWSWMVTNNIDVIGIPYIIGLEVVDAFGNTDRSITTLEVVATSAPVPEPATMLLFGLGLLGLAGVSRRKK